MASPAAHPHSRGSPPSGLREFAASRQLPFSEATEAAFQASHPSSSPFTTSASTPPHGLSTSTWDASRATLRQASTHRVRGGAMARHAHNRSPMLKKAHGRGPALRRHPDARTPHQRRQLSRSLSATQSQLGALSRSSALAGDSSVLTVPSAVMMPVHQRSSNIFAVDNPTLVTVDASPQRMVQLRPRSSGQHAMSMQSPSQPEAWSNTRRTPRTLSPLRPPSLPETGDPLSRSTTGAAGTTQVPQSPIQSRSPGPTQFMHRSGVLEGGNSVLLSSVSMLRDADSLTLSLKDELNDDDFALARQRWASTLVERKSKANATHQRRVLVASHELQAVKEVVEQGSIKAAADREALVLGTLTRQQRQRMGRKYALLNAWKRAVEMEKRSYNSTANHAAVRLQMAETFAPSKGTRPSEIKLATVFEVFESVMHRFGRFASLMEIVRDVLARAVYVDPPQRPPMESRSLVDGGTVRMKGVRSASIGVEDALTSYYASTPYYMVVSDKEGRDLLLQGVDTFSIKRAARSKNRELLLRLLRRWKMAVRIQKQIRSQGRLQTQIVNAQAMIDTLQEERKELESVEGMAQLLAALDPDQHEAAMLKLLEQLEGRPQLLERLAREMLTRFLSPESAVKLAVTGVRDNHQVMAADLLLAAAGLIDPSGNRLHGADGDSTRLDILSKVLDVVDPASREEMLKHLLEMLSDSEIKMLIRELIKVEDPMRAKNSQAAIMNIPSMNASGAGGAGAGAGGAGGGAGGAGAGTGSGTGTGAGGGAGGGGSGGGGAEGTGGEPIIEQEPLGPGTKFHPLISSLEIENKMDLFVKLLASMKPDVAARCLSDTVVEAQFSHMNRVDKERVVVPLLEHMDQGAKCRLITCPFHNHGRDPRALSKEDLDAAIEAAKRDAEAKAKADEEARLAAEQQALRESAAGQRLRRWLKKRGAFVKQRVPWEKYMKKAPRGMSVAKNKVKKANVLNLIYDIYEKKLVLDATDLARAKAAQEHVATQDLADFTKYYLLQKFGLPSLRDSYLYSLVHAIRKLASSSERIRLFGALVGVIDSRRFSKRVCDMVLGLVRILFPKFTSTVMRTRPEHKFFVTSYDALRAVRKTFPEYHVPFADSQMPLTAERRAKLVQRVESVAQKFPDALAYARRRDQLRKEAQERAEKMRKERKAKAAAEAKKAKKAAASDSLDDILGLADVRAKDKLQAKRKAAVGLDRFVGDAARGDDEDPRSLIRVDSTWRPPPGFVARDDLEHEAKLGGFHIDAVVVSFDELLTICVEMWHAQNKENMSNLRELFHAFDDDGNGVLSFGEFEKLIVACVDRDLPQRQIATLFDEVTQLDGSGDSISATAFCVLCNKHGITPGRAAKHLGLRAAGLAVTAWAGFSAPPSNEEQQQTDDGKAAEGEGSASGEAAGAEGAAGAAEGQAAAGAEGGEANASGAGAGEGGEGGGGSGGAGGAGDGSGAATGGGETLEPIAEEPGGEGEAAT